MIKDIQKIIDEEKEIYGDVDSHQGPTKKGPCLFLVIALLLIYLIDALVIWKIIPRLKVVAGRASEIRSDIKIPKDNEVMKNLMSGLKERWQEMKEGLQKKAENKVDETVEDATKNATNSIQKSIEGTINNDE